MARAPTSRHLPGRRLARQQALRDWRDRQSCRLACCKRWRSSVHSHHACSIDRLEPANVGPLFRLHLPASDNGRPNVYVKAMAATSTRERKTIRGLVHFTPSEGKRRSLSDQSAMDRTKVAFFLGQRLAMTRDPTRHGFKSVARCRLEARSKMLFAGAKARSRLDIVDKLFIILQRNG